MQNTVVPCITKGDTMKIKAIVWREQDIHHISRHQISPDEVEEVCSDKSVIRKADREITGENPLYYVYGQTENGRYIIVILMRFPNSTARIVTARDMNDKERKLYHKHGTRR